MKTQIKCEIVHKELRYKVTFDKDNHRRGSIGIELRDEINKHFPNVESIAGNRPQLIFKGFK